MKSNFSEQKGGIVYPPEAIPLATAAIWAQNWRDRKVMQDVNGYLIPMGDITEAMLEAGITNMRGYLGIDGEGENHLLIVAVDASGNDMIDEANGQFVYDHTLPCPQQCGKANVLNGGV
ncbi:hypothetical protein H2O64_22040 [Kordia sp. YSTF-M3]|uniref:Uncharacterized protein n=1 Tax=Kordia aestuariivivens TaxID=2759037 RepID=A0ABR7QFM0_9FLAO|nr:hypothetical protein [Kordia aestuariivivens]MBC8757366.1 hypothetical protein [Kordia aestuariivivens]